MSRKFVLGVEFDFTGYGLERVHNDPEIEVRELSGMEEGVLAPAELEGVDAFVSGGIPINDISLKKADRLKIISRFGAGFDNVDLDACTEKGVLVCNAPQGVREPVAEAVLSYMMSLTTKLKTFDRHIRNNGFKSNNKYRTKCVQNKTLGIIGFGGIGSRLVEIIEPLNMNILVYDPYVEEEKIKKYGAEKTNLSTLLKNSDYITLHVPLTEKTRNMLAEDQFKMMKETAIFINTSRGGVYRDRVLARALRENWIGGAGIDVFEDEPHVENNPLFAVAEDNNIILTPHIAGAGNNDEGMSMVGGIVVDSVISIKNEKWPHNILNPEAVKEKIPEQYLSPSYK